MDLSNWHLFSHANCLDGCASVILGLNAGVKHQNIHWLNPGHVDEDLAQSPAFLDDRIPILLVDIAPYSNEMADRLSYRGRFVVIDHHKQSERFAGRYGFKVSLGNRACGAELFRDWLVQVAGMREFDRLCYRRFAEFVDDHDRWVHHFPISQDLARYFAFVGQDAFIERFTNVEHRFEESPALTPNGSHYWKESEREVLGVVKAQIARRHKQLLKKFVVRPRKVGDREVRVGYLISDEAHTSELLNTYLLENPDVDLACQINFQVGSMSFRGVGKVSIPDLVVPLGGGGHFDAGGCPIPAGLYDTVIGAANGE